MASDREPIDARDLLEDRCWTVVAWMGGEVVANKVDRFDVDHRSALVSVAAQG